jgi:SAM-dependent methyltransferase
MFDLNDPADAIMALSVSRDIAEQDRMLGAASGLDYYYHVGRQNLFLIGNLLRLRQCYIRGAGNVQTILDFASGFGRVTRWLRAAFPHAEIHAYDIDPAGPEWCEAHLGVTSVKRPLLNKYDLVWAGSVFTHLPQDAAITLLDQLKSFPRREGILAFTTMGRGIVARAEGYDWETDPSPGLHFRLGRELYGQLVAQFQSEGYGFVNYPGSTGYGMCLAEPSWYSRHLLQTPDFTQFGLLERPDGAQDLSTFLRVDIGSPCLGALWEKAVIAAGS